MQQALYQATTLTFEELGFMFPVPEDEPQRLDPQNSSGISVAFQGEFEGKVVLQVENGMVSAIAANMLGEETPLDEELQRDALGEIANVICGNALPIIAGKKAIFKLSAPTFIDASDETEIPQARAVFNLEEGRAEVSIYVRNEKV